MLDLPGVCNNVERLNRGSDYLVVAVVDGAAACGDFLLHHALLLGFERQCLRLNNLQVDELRARSHENHAEHGTDHDSRTATGVRRLALLAN